MENDQNFPFQHPILDPLKMCKHCRLMLEPSEFKGYGTGGKVSDICKRCTAVNAVAHARAQSGEEKGREVAIKSFIAKVRGQDVTAPHISELCSEMIKRFGDLESFSREYYRQIQEAASKRPGSKTALDAYGAIVKLVSASTVNRASSPDVSDLTDADIEAEIVKLAPRLFDEQGKLTHETGTG